jgi:hypothetical protein
MGRVVGGCRDSNARGRDTGVSRGNAPAEPPAADFWRQERGGLFSHDDKQLVFASNRFGKVAGETNVFIADWK